MSRDDGPSGDEIIRMLTERVVDVVTTLYPGAFIDNGIGYLSYKGKGSLGSFQIHLTGPRAGQWCRFSQNPDRAGGKVLGGGLLHLISYARTGGTTDFREAFRWAKEDYFRFRPTTETEEERQARRRREEEHRRIDQVKRAEQEAAEEAKRAKRRKTAGGQWLDASPINDTAADLYLLNRGLPLSLIRAVCTPDVMRFGASVHYDMPPFTDHPGLLGRVSKVDGSGAALGRVFLTNEGRKADLPDPKLTIAPMEGGAVRLGGMARKIGVAEGMETALGAMAVIRSAMPVWATLGTSGLGSFEVPPGVEEVVIYADGDWERERGGRIITPGMDAAYRLASRLRAIGIPFSIAAPPRGKDWLDVWLEVRDAYGAA